jgi:hypothetical protein
MKVDAFELFEPDLVEASVGKWIKAVYDRLHDRTVHPPYSGRFFCMTIRMT